MPPAGLLHGGSPGGPQGFPWCRPKSPAQYGALPDNGLGLSRVDDSPVGRDARRSGGSPVGRDARQKDVSPVGRGTRRSGGSPVGREAYRRDDSPVGRDACRSGFVFPAYSTVGLVGRCCAEVRSAAPSDFFNFEFQSFKIFFKISYLSI